MLLHCGPSSNVARTGGDGAGFTLIEVLITLTVFTMAVSSAVVCMRAATHAWERVGAVQRRDAEIQHALHVFAADLRQAAVVDEAGLRERADAPGTPTLTVAVSAARRLQRAGEGGAWQQVSYSVEEDREHRSKNWVRKAVPHVGKQAATTGGTDTVLVRGIEEVAFAYIDAGRREEAWQRDSALPTAVEVTLRPAHGKPVTQAVWVPAGALGN